jgi:hypothetical protein
MASGGDPAQLGRLRAILAQTRAQLQEFLGQSQSGPGPAPGGDKARVPHDVI